MRKRPLLLLAVLLLVAAGCSRNESDSGLPVLKPGMPIDNFHGVYVYYNGETTNVYGRNFAPDGYNLGLKYQCVEFAKRYYYQYLNHKMPDSYGNARDFFDPQVADGDMNPARDLRQYTNPGSTKPEISDLVVLEGTSTNPYGHVAIISRVDASKIEIIQQNSGPYGKSRVEYNLYYQDGKWRIDSQRLMGWLRKE
ncbi:MAG: CHAP domain-containing protein [Bacteroidales bacterium]